ncbi:MAG TPA: hypothetical protein VFI47_00220 [Acidimicrobiales bacterium]|nr:hypothetical protein [Acidimicrobiales bacterium]
MRRLIPLTLAALVVAIVAYRRRSIDRAERELGIGRHAPPAAP